MITCLTGRTYSRSNRTFSTESEINSTCKQTYFKTTTRYISSLFKKGVLNNKKINKFLNINIWIYINFQLLQLNFIKLIKTIVYIFQGYELNLRGGGWKRFCCGGGACPADTTIIVENYLQV